MAGANCSPFNIRVSKIVVYMLIEFLSNSFLQIFFVYRLKNFSIAVLIPCAIISLSCTGTPENIDSYSHARKEAGPGEGQPAEHAHEVCMLKRDVYLRARVVCYTRV